MHRQAKTAGEDTRKLWNDYVMFRDQYRAEVKRRGVYEDYGV